MLGLLLPLVLKLGVPSRLAAPVAKGALVVAGVALLIGGFLLWDHFDDRAAVREHEVERELNAADARETAADERVADAITNAKTEQEMHDAIDNAPTGGELSPAARALSCERLRKLGRIPAACRPESGDGSQAGPD